MVKNPFPSINSIRELYASISSNLAFQLFFNPWVNPYTLGGKRSVLAEGVMCTLVTVLITIPAIAKALSAARRTGELSSRIPEISLMRWLPKNRWLFALLVSAIFAPAGGLLFAFIFKFYGFTSWTFYQLFLAKFAYLTVLGKVLAPLAIIRFTQPDIN
ncbi:MAG: hypothetical protein WAQ07_01105 [Candidatus Omnitrophota bacterium]